MGRDARCGVIFGKGCGRGVSRRGCMGVEVVVAPVEMVAAQCWAIMSPYGSAEMEGMY